MNYKYAWKEYRLILNEDGKIECRDLSIAADTVDEVKAAIRAQIETEKALPRVSVLFFDGAWRGKDTSYTIGTSTLKNAGRNHYAQVWVTSKDAEGKTERQKKSASEVYPDTPDNRAAFDEYVRLMKEAAILEERAFDIKDAVECVEVVEG